MLSIKITLFLAKPKGVFMDPGRGMVRSPKKGYLVSVLNRSVERDRNPSTSLISSTDSKRQEIKRN
jgi:hypothetical protein